jgi:DNA replication protein DnaD
MFHRYMKCFYIRLNIKKSDWKSHSSIVQMIKIKIAEIIEEIKLIINRIFKRNAKTANKEKKKSNKFENTNHIENENSFYSFFAMFLSFAINLISYKLLNCWIFDCALNIHVCNDSSRFQLDHFINFNN